MASEPSSPPRLRILVVDDHPGWRDRLTEALQKLEKTIDGKETHVDTAEDEIRAQEKLTARAYDLAVVDLGLLGDPPAGKEPDDRGFELLREIWASPAQRRCGVIVITGAPTSERYHRALKEFDVKAVVVKPELDARPDPDGYLLELARAAVLEARVRGTAARRASRTYLTLTFNAEGWVESELRDPAITARDRLPEPAAFDIDSFVRRADNINLFLTSNKNYTGWRDELSDIGAALFKTVAEAPTLYANWAGNKPNVREPGDLWLRFRGPQEGFGVPVDLLLERKDYLCLHHIVSREVERAGFTRNLPPFSNFIGKLAEAGKNLRLLLVAANSDGTIPAVEEEAQRLAERIPADLARMGLRCETTLLAGKDATYARVEEELRHGHHHLFHYAGHGRYDDDHPWASGLVLCDDHTGKRALSADDLRLIVGPDLQLVFLSCCLGAVNKNRPRSDEFCGIYHALAEANVPTVMGYRWVIHDSAALKLATTFYAHLWRTLCPGEAVLDARQEAARGVLGRDDHTWAAPVLLAQSP